MENGKLTIKKGYTLTVVSWENDGDNYQTNSQTFSDKEYAIKIAKMCNTLFASCNNGSGGIGNTNDGDESTAERKILEYLDNHVIFENQTEMNDDENIGKVMNINCNLMGGSEWYYSRVCESVTITYSPEDVYLETIKF